MIGKSLASTTQHLPPVGVLLLSLVVMVVLLLLMVVFGAAVFDQKYTFRFNFELFECMNE